MNKSLWKISAIILAATIGEGVFALPYVFYQSGWLLSLAYLAVLAAVVSIVQVIYLKTLEQVGEKKRLLGLAKRYLGNAGFWVGWVVIVVGLMLALVAYLILGPRFITLALPMVPMNVAFLVFWLFISIPTLLSNHRAVEVEVAGIVVVACIILFVFGNALPNATFTIAPAVNVQNIFLPFSIILLSLAGWTGIEPVYESEKHSRRSRRTFGVVLGTIFAAVLYALFVAGIFGSATRITPDTLSGIADWAAWKRFLLAALGLFAVGTGSVPFPTRSAMPWSAT